MLVLMLPWLMRLLTTATGDQVHCDKRRAVEELETRAPLVQT